MQGAKFRYYFKDAGGLFVVHDANFGVELRTSIQYLTNAPKEWQNLSSSYIRSDKFRGVFTKYAEQVIYVGDGKKIIDHYASFYGPQSELYFFIEVQDNPHLNYVPYFDGKVNFERYNYANTSSNSDIIDNDILEIIEANEDVQYEIELTDANSEFILLDGVGLRFITNWKIGNGYGSTSSYYTGDHILNATLVTSEDIGQRSAQRQNGISLPGGLPATTNYLYLAKTTRKILVEYDFYVNAQHTNYGGLLSSSVLLNIGLQRFDITQTAIALYSLLPNVLGTVNVYGSGSKIHHVQGQFEIDVNKDDTLYLVLNVNGDESNAYFNYLDGLGNSFVKFTSVAPEKKPTKHRAIRPLVLWNEILNKLTDGKVVEQSTFLHNSNTHLLIPGSSLRVDDKISIKTSVKDFLKYCYVNLLGVITNKSKGKISIDSIQSTYNNLTSINLGQVKNLTWNFSKEHLVAQIKVGYPNMEIGKDLINGKFEYNQTNHFTTGQSKIKAEYEIVSPYIASMYLQEILRSKLSEERTTDNDKENLVYLVDSEIGTPEIIYTELADITGSNQIKVGGDLTGHTNIAIYYDNGTSQNIVITSATYDSLTGATTLITSNTITNGSYTNFSIEYFNAALWHPYRPLYTSVTGVLDALKAYNLTITPKEILKLHLPIIKGGLYNSSAIPELDIISFQSGDKNVVVSKTLGAVVTTENTNESLQDFADSFYIPVSVTFTTDYNRNFYSLMNSNEKYKLISFIWKNEIIRGYILEVHSNDGNYKENNFTLLLQNGADLIKIIK